jgi:hypothetical protein
MKRVILVISMVLAVPVLVAQNFNSFPPKQRLCFHTPDSEMYKSTFLRIQDTSLGYLPNFTSIDLTKDGNDSTWFNKCLNPNQRWNDCEIYSNSLEYRLISRKNDVFHIAKNIKVGNIWEFLQINDSSSIQATVDRTFQISLNGTTDSLAVIRLDGTNDQSKLHPLHGKSFTISKEEGLHQFFEIENVPSRYQYIERFFPKPLALETFYSFEVGDVFEYKKTQETVPQLSYIRRTVKEIIPSQSGDSLTVIFQEITEEHRFNSTNTSSKRMAYVFTNDVFRYYDNQIPGDLDAPDPKFQLSVNSDNKTVFHVLGGYRAITEDSCWRRDPFEGEVVWDQVYVEGLGMTEYTTGYQGQISGSEQLIYAKTSTQETGTKHSFLSVSTPRSEPISIYPNPGEDYITISMNHEDISDAREVSIIDVSGKIVWKNKEENLHRVDVSHFQPGVYFIQVMTDDGRFQSRWIKR